MSIVNVGRSTSGGTIWGSPIVIGRPCPECGTRHGKAEILACYRQYLWKKLNSDPEFKEKTKALRGARLYCPGCGFNGQFCHARVLERAIAWLNS